LFVASGDSKLTPSVQKRTSNEGYVYFGLRGAFDPDEMTLRLGITPTSSCAQGARHPERGLPKTSLWKVSNERIVAECIDVYELADQMVSKHEGKKHDSPMIRAMTNHRLYFSPLFCV
jgi:hypothetical protein